MVYVGDIRQAVHVFQDRPVRGVRDRTAGIPERQAPHVGQGAPFGNLSDGEVELLAGDEVDRIRREQGGLWFDRDLGADEPDRQCRVRPFERLRNLHVPGEGR